MSDHPPLRDEPGSWPVVESRDLHRDDWVVALREDRITVPDGSGEPFRRLVLEHPGAAIVLAVDDDGRAPAGCPSPTCSTRCWPATCRTHRW